MMERPVVSRGRAGLRLCALGVLFAVAVMAGPASGTSTGEVGSGEDMALHLATIARLASGEPFYVSVGEELRNRRFPTASIFNWRTPALYQFIALSPLTARIVLGALAVVVLFATVKLLSPQPVTVVILGAILQSGALGMAADSTAWMFPEVWASVFIGLSTLAYASRHWTAGAILALTALFIRELAAPYVALCTVLALRGRRKPEVGTLMAGGVLYALYYGYHVSNVLAHQRPGDIAHAASWIQWGGVEFILATLRTSNLLNDMPVPVLACALTLLAAGTLHEQLSLHLRGTVVVYMLLFAVVGQPFNWYWGWVPGLVVPTVMAHGPLVIQRLLLDAVGRQQAVEVP